MDASEIHSNRRGRNPGTGFVLGGGIALLSITAAEAVYPTYSVRQQAISYLGGSGVPTEIFWNAAVILVGILWITSTFLLFRGTGARIKPAAFYLAGIGFLLVGTSPWNLRPETHYLGANLIFLFGAISCFAGSRLTKGALTGISVMAGVVSILSYLSGYVGLGNIIGSGGIERMIYYPILLWVIAFGGYVMNHFQEIGKTSGNALNAKVHTDDDLN